MKKLTILALLTFGGYSALFSQVCPQVGTINIPVGGLSSSSLPFASYSNIDIIVNGNFTIDNNFTTSGCTFYIATNKNITVEDNTSASFKIISSKLFSCGNTMWNGILVKDHGTLDMSGSTLEDAKIGVQARNINGFVILANNTFNKNNVHVYADHSNGNNLLVYGNTFDCIDLGNPYSNYGSTLEAPFLGLQTDISIKGVSITNMLTIGNPTFSINSIYRCKFGISLENCTATIKNNHFEEIGTSFLYPYNPAYPYYAPYTAIIAFSFLGTHRIEIGGSGLNETNFIHKCIRGFDINDYNYVEINYNRFTNNVPAPPAPNTGPGSIAITVNIINHVGNTSINITNNKIRHHDTGIGYYFANQNLINNDVLNITDNDIERTNILKGINGIVTDANLSSILSTGINQFNVSFNRLWNLNKGLHFLNTSGRNVNAVTNKIKINYLFMNQAFGIVDQNNLKPYYFDNRVFGPGISLAEKPYVGLESFMSITSTWLCNKVFNMGRSMLILGYTPSTISGNLFSNAYDAFTMGSNAVIGAQGDINTASDNRWLGSFTNSKTFTINQGCNTHSKFYLRTGNQFFPQVGTNSTDPSNLAGEEYNIASLGLNEVFNPGPQLNCPPLFTLPFLPLLQETVRDHVIFDKYLDHSRWHSKQDVFNALQIDSTLLYDPIIDSFAVNGAGSYLNLISIENELMNHNYTQAITLSNLMAPQNLPEENYQSFYKIYSTYFGNFQLSQTEYDQLVEIALQCPLNGGRAVFESRSLRNFIDKQFYTYDDLCEEYAPKDFTLPEKNEDEFFSIFPNPNSGTFNLNNTNSISGKFTLYNLAGIEIYSCTVDSASKKTVNLNNLSSGFFIYEIVFEDNSILNGKLVIE